MLLINPCSSKAHCLWLYRPHLALHWRGDQRLVLRTRTAPSVNTWTDKGRKDLSQASLTAGCDGTGPTYHTPHGIPRSLSCSSASGGEADETVGLHWAPGHATATGRHLRACQHHAVPESLTLWTELISKLYGKLWKIPEAELVFRSMALNARYQSGRQDGELKNHFFKEDTF